MLVKKQMLAFWHRVFKPRKKKSVWGKTFLLLTQKGCDCKKEKINKVGVLKLRRSSTVFYTLSIVLIFSLFRGYLFSIMLYKHLKRIFFGILTFRKKKFDALALGAFYLNWTAQRMFSQKKTNAEIELHITSIGRFSERNGKRKIKFFKKKLQDD